jgi:hypothetical protein
MSIVPQNPGTQVFRSYAPGPVPGSPTDPNSTTAAGGVESRARNALVLGILGLFPVLGLVAGIPAIVVGRHALRLIADSRGEVSGHRVAQVGIWLGAVSVLEAITFFVLVYA